MRDHSNHRSGSRFEVIDALLERCEFDRRTEVIPVTEADGRVCAATVYSVNELPNALTSNMDAVAVHFDDFEGGEPDTSAWTRGKEWEFCNTGIAMPQGFDTAIAIERVEVSDDNERLVINVQPEERFQSTTQPGANLQPGDVLAYADDVLNPALLACLNMGGHTEVEVVARPRVAFIPTGNELVDADVELPLGKNVESNATMICAKIAAWGGEPARFPIVKDDPEAILAALKKAAAECDIVAINAGSSKGSDDWTCEILEREGEMLFHEVDQGPGRHCSFSVLDNTPVIGISGPPFGAEFTADFFIKPFVDAYLGAYGTGKRPPTVWARMLDSKPMGPRPVTVCVRAALRRTPQGEFVAWLPPMPERPKLRECSYANALACIGTDSHGWEEGGLFEIELRWPYTLPPLMEE